VKEEIQNEQNIEEWEKTGLGKFDYGAGKVRDVCGDAPLNAIGTKNYFSDPASRASQIFEKPQ
jgi:hypothetical protein